MAAVSTPSSSPLDGLLAVAAALRTGSDLGPTLDAIAESIHRMVEAVQDYVPGYRLLQDPQFDPPTQATRGQTKVSIFIEVKGAGDFLPPYSGNLDIMTAAATRAGEGMAHSVVEERAQRAPRNHEARRRELT